MLKTTIAAASLPTGRIVPVVLIALIAATAHAQPPAPAAMPVEVLKDTYLECERAAVGGELGTFEIMHCSVVYEELKRRAFGGDFMRLKAWADRQLAAAEW